jgi:hypothetical protein
MKRLVKTTFLFVIVADALPLVCILTAPVLPPLPWMLRAVCVYSPPVLGLLFLLEVVTLKLLRLLPARSDAVLIGTVLALIGLVEPLFYWT